MYIVMDYANMGDLASYVIKYGPIAEEKLKQWFREILLAINHLHENNIVHRDIKPGNILLHKFNDGEIHAVVTDFGFSRFLDPDSLCKSIGGTPVFWAPEMTNPYGYSKEADVWALGCVLYAMLFAKVPFGNKVIQSCDIKNISRSMNDSTYGNNVKHLLLSMLRLNPVSRITLRQSLEHQWFQSETKQRPEKRQRLQ